MLQTTEYQVGPYMRWWWRTKNFSSVEVRRNLNRTKAARLLQASLTFGIAAELVIGVLVILVNAGTHSSVGLAIGAALIIFTPFLWAQIVVVPLLIGRWLIVGPRERKLIAASERIFANHPGLKIAIVGSYGKTSMKELLATVLGEAKVVAATPGNKNVAISHAYFAKRLTGKEDILLIEYGEGAPGDVSRFAAITHPSAAVITGVAPAHLDNYPTLQAAGQDIFSVNVGLAPKNVYVNGEAAVTREFITPGQTIFTSEEALGYKVLDVQTELTGTSFMLQKESQKLYLRSRLIGQHQVATLAFVAAYSLSLGLSDQQVIDGIAQTKPYEHRMQPYQLSGAWIIDDTYNGNIEGIRAGTKLLELLPAKRKIYVTPGLVEQGIETERVHLEMGRLIANAKPDTVVLMRNSVSSIIERGLQNANYKGQVRIETDPLRFYVNLDQFVAAGDLVLMQNDWTDNYH